MARRPPFLVRLLWGFISHILFSLLLFALVMGGLYLYMNHDPEFKQKVFSTLGGEMQDMCRDVSADGVDLRQMNYRNLDLKRIVSIATSDASTDDKKLQLQQAGHAVATDNQDMIKQTMIAQGVPADKADDALAFQPVMVQYNIPIPLAPFAFAIKDRPNAEQFYTAFNADKIGANGAGAIGFLTKALHGSDTKLHQAARASLTLIGTEEAKKALISTP